MISADIVIGANYGDEGKGQRVHNLATAKSCVVRFNGGAQAGHTVIAGERQHIFHQFGSGSFRGASTFLSREHIVNPVLYFDERKYFPDAWVYVDGKSKVTTIVDMMVNRLIEAERGNARHGSCGLGINETVRRNLDRTRLVFNDIGTSHFHDMIEHIWQVDGPERLVEMGYEHLLTNYFSTVTIDRIEDYVITAVEMKNDVRIVTGLSELVGGYKHFVFEGAQGLLLSERNMFWFPHLTRSDPGVINASDILSELSRNDIPDRTKVHYVTRPYLTRHGAGPLVGESDFELYPRIKDTTNVANPWQGVLRFAPLNLDYLRAFVHEDFARCAVPSYGILVISCWDQVQDEKIHYIIGGDHHTATPSELLELLKQRFPGFSIKPTGFY